MPLYKLEHPLYPDKRILQLHQDNAFQYQETTQDKRYAKWYERIKRKKDSIYNQVTQIYRVTPPTQREKIFYNEDLMGQDWKENPWEFDHLVGRWEKPIFKKDLDEETGNVISAQILTHQTQYDIDYTPDKILSLAAMSENPDSLSLIVDTGSKQWGGQGIYTIEEFAYATFQQLVEKGRTGEAITVSQTQTQPTKKARIPSTNYPTE